MPRHCRRLPGILLSIDCRLHPGYRFHMLLITVRYSIKPGQRNAFLDAVATIGFQATCKAENGCLAYDYYFPVDSADELFLFEKWENRDVWEVHKTAPHFAGFKPLKEKYILDSKIDLFDTV